MATIKEIAQKSGFSTATVSRILNADATFSASKKTRETIFRIANSLGYTSCHQLKAPYIKAALLYAVTPQKELEDIFYNNLRHTIIESARENNINLILVRHVDEIDSTIDGFISVGLLSNDELALLEKENLNGVFVGFNPNPHHYNSVEFNFREIVEEAIDLFLESGISKIGFIGGPFWPLKDSHRSVWDIRKKFFESYMRELNIFNKEYVFLGNNFSAESGYQVGKRITERYSTNDLPQGFLIASDPLSVGVLQAFNEKQIKIPDQTAIISINDIDVAKYVSPPLTTYRLDVNELGKVAVEKLRDTVNTPERAKQIISLSSKLIYRKSFTPLNSKH
ncbi:LacI family DNA-binding transcriptional regulator [Secundilactobacillus hailunensis]|uniref:LacI family DNA-binding transcriptional regulator n=1 Tax=Secundilactobacillus hailunensis TaxID=2559923 RepID=A0ABW1T991_9LACO|nr:LacI family DNA-binding transcriptional regulator [Secundilactobacillus hailunensis]